MYLCVYLCFISIRLQCPSKWVPNTLNNALTLVFEFVKFAGVSILSSTIQYLLKLQLNYTNKYFWYKNYSKDLL